MTNRKKILITFIVIILIGLIIELSSYLWQSNRLIKQGYRFENNAKNAPYPTKIVSFSHHYFKELDKDRIIKNIVGKEYKSPAIMVFGDVYINSYDNNNNTFAHKLSKLTKRPVYNMGESGWGISQMYFLLKNEKEIEKINPETIIFFYHNDLKNRLTSFSFYPHHTYLNLKYKIKNGELIEDKPIVPQLYRLYGIRNIERYLGWRIATSKNESVQQKNYDLIQKLFEESKTIAGNKYPSLKNFIILRLPAPWETMKKLEEYSYYNKIANAEYNMWENLKDEGFIVIDVTELTTTDLNKQENHSKDSSLTPEAIDTFLPAVVAKTNIEAKKQEIKKEPTTIKKQKKVKYTTKQKKKKIQTESKVEKSTDIIKPTEETKEIKETNISNEEPPKKKFWDRFKRKKKETIDN